jgi:PhoH-like ATPase
MKKEKLYVLDTNVLLHDPRALYAFKGASVGIPAMVLEELDSFKKEPSDRGRNARETIRQLDMLRDKGSLQSGIKLDHDSTLKVLFIDGNQSLTLPFRLSLEDNEILLTALAYQKEGYDVRFVSKDLNARVKADALGIQARDYLKERISEDHFYKGWVRIEVPAVQFKKEVPDDLLALTHEYEFTVNEFVLAQSQNNPYNYRVFRYAGGKHFLPVYEPRFRWPLKARNPQQLMALDLLLDEQIQFVTLFGPAGTGKTFLALLAGLHQVIATDLYQKLLVSRPVVPLGRDIGYLPGTVEEKLRSWMLPIYDNIDFIVHAAQTGAHMQEVEQEQQSGKHKKRARSHKKHGGGLGSLDDLIHQDKLSLEAITYMRGRSIPYQFILIDEVQNLSPHEVKTLVSRVGQGSKIILTGDPYQIDSPYLDFSSNGLVVTSEKFKGQKIFGTVYLETSERSELSQLASDLL